MKTAATKRKKYLSALDKKLMDLDDICRKAAGSIAPRTADALRHVATDWIDCNSGYAPLEGYSTPAHRINRKAKTVHIVFKSSVYHDESEGGDEYYSVARFSRSGKSWVAKTILCDGDAGDMAQVLLDLI